MKKNVFLISGILLALVAIVAAFLGGAEASGVVMLTAVGLTVDEQVAEKLKAELKNLGDQVDAKINSFAEKVKANGNEAATALTSKLKEELSGEIAKYNTLHSELTKRMDLIETKAGKFGEVMARKSMADIFMQKFSDAGVKPKFKGTVEFTSKDFEQLEIKATDMTPTNTFTNNVPGYQHLPEIHFDPDRRTRIRDLILQGTTQQTAVEYIRETAFEDNTDVTAPGAEFNQNDFDMTAYTANVRKITAYVMLAEEMMEDVEGMTSYILARLPGKLNKDEDTQILAGAGTGQNLSGLITNATAYSDNLADSAVQRIDVLVDAVRQVVDDEYVPSFILLNPADVYSIALTKGTDGHYILPWILGVASPQLAGVPIVMSTAQTSGTFLVGSREAAQVFFKKELAIEFSKESEDNFIKGMVTVRAQKRLALAIYKPTALLTGTFSVALAQGSA